MKKSFLTLLGLVAISTTAVAQQEVKFGPKAGVNFANLSGMDDSEMKIGFHVGFVAEIKFNEKFSVQPEILYSAQGVKYSRIMIPSGTTEYKNNIDYINVPIIAKYYIIDGFSIEAGPQFGFLVKAEQEANINGTNMKDDVKSSGNYKSIEFGIGTGLAYDLPMGLFVNLRYNIGVSAIQDTETLGGEIKKDAPRNNVFQVGVGYKF